MDFARLRTLRELSLRKTMAAVAEALLISPSAVSQQIAQLEDETGVELVERRGRGVRLTPAGQRLVDHAGRVIGILEEAKTDLAELKKTVAGELRVSAFPSVAASLIPPTIRAMSARFPDLATIFEELEPDDSLAALRAWQTDVAIVDDLTTSASLSETQVEMLHLLDDHLHVLLPRDHPLAERPHLTLPELATERWVLDTTSATYSDVIVGACRNAGFDPIVNARCHSFEVVRAMVEAGCSVSINPGLRGRDHIGTLRLKEIRPIITRRIFVAFRSGERRNPAIAEFVKELRVVANAMTARR
ncbi:LysR family transcriptional regulator [Bradyrhizobium sp.]|jgi:DNA-binding transcriptional LysR family regulator|uniref:LysR family transcriptional regulator n=1 Tax=Bradyrhizobium sp. TaxID=376 RepID=UPI002DDCC9BC|nr:LysR substrate-binding domain-containing protein [Bradyrhizobium sp.]HEV2155542.1 LysR substrate-binding domain-containing protein [Bradyrhizobium sp.]